MNSSRLEEWGFVGLHARSLLSAEVYQQSNRFSAGFEPFEHQMNDNCASSFESGFEIRHCHYAPCQHALRMLLQVSVPMLKQDNVGTEGTWKRKLLEM